MTADAKVGLLLGLIFIVMIAFLVNGLPSFLQTANAEDAAVGVSITIPSPDEDLVIDGGMVQRSQTLQSNDIPLRQVPAPQEVINLDEPAPAAAYQPAVYQPQTPAVVETPKSATVQTHVVQSGENLALIAQRYYGKEEGNRRVVINALFKANNSILSSPDKVRVGQKLTIPPLDTLMARPVQQTVQTPQRTETTSTFREGLANLFKRSDQETNSGVRVHVVKDGESLWGIAESTLGDGKRYKEILKLNKAIKDADDVVTGTRLKIPSP